eukprot:7755459-Alexandrium_andersonii.AAC.1
MHVLLSNDVASVEIAGFLEALREHGVTLAQVDEFTSQYRGPKGRSPNRLPETFFQSRLDPGGDSLRGVR